MTDCCASGGAPESGDVAFEQSAVKMVVRCPTCRTPGCTVERLTVLHHVKHEHLKYVGEQKFRFCGEQNCPVVYYEDRGTHFTVHEVREPVGAKMTGDERPICYCFGFTEGDAREEIVRTGRSTIPATVSGLIKARMCACDVRNPSGACCLGEVNRTVKRLSDEFETPCSADG